LKATHDFSPTLKAATSFGNPWTIRIISLKMNIKSYYTQYLMNQLVFKFTMDLCCLSFWHHQTDFLDCADLLFEAGWQYIQHKYGLGTVGWCSRANKRRKSARLSQLQPPAPQNYRFPFPFWKTIISRLSIWCQFSLQI